MRYERSLYLFFNAIDFGERIRLAKTIQEHLGCGDQHEINQCTLLHLRAELEGAMQKRPRRIPSIPRVEDLANNMREKEIAEAREMISPHQTSSGLIEIMSVTHDVLKAHRNRDFRTICLLLIDEMQKLELQSIRIVEVDEDSRSTAVRNFVISEAAGGSGHLCFISHHGRVRWTQPSIPQGINLWKDRRGQFDCARDINVANADQFVE